MWHKRIYTFNWRILNVFAWKTPSNHWWSQAWHQIYVDRLTNLIQPHYQWLMKPVCTTPLLHWDKRTLTREHAQTLRYHYFTNKWWIRLSSVVCTVAFIWFHVDFIIHCLGSGCCSLPLRTAMKADSSSIQSDRRERKTVLKPLHLLRLMMMLSLAWSRTVWGRFTPIIPLGALERHHAPKHRHSITFYMIAGRAGNNGPATMSFCITDKCLIWLT